jgi:hypothetical protein
MAVGISAAAPIARAAFDDPILIFKPKFLPLPPPAPPAPPIPPPAGSFEDPCGLAVDVGGDIYISDYHHDVVDVFGPTPFSGVNGPTLPYVGQLTEVDPLDGPCGLALDGAGNLYVNDFHRNVTRYTVSPFDTGTVIAGAPVDSTHPTGVAVDPATDLAYVDERTHLAVFDSSGAELGQIGAGSLLDGYGVAVSRFPATAGRVYVPDAVSDTVKVYESTLGSTVPVATIDGSGVPGGHFVSLRNSVVAVDDTTGEVYVADDLQPAYSEQEETVIYVFAPTGAYEGRLKYSVESARPPGLAVDNSGGPTQGRVYVTSGGTELAEIYGYGPGSATSVAMPLSPAAAPATDATAAGISALGPTGPAPAEPTPSVLPPAAPESVAAAVPSARPDTARRAHRKARRGHGVKRHSRSRNAGR